MTVPEILINARLVGAIAEPFRALQRRGCAKEGFVSTAPVLTEVTHLLMARAGASQSVAFNESIAGGACEIPEPLADAAPRAHAPMNRYRNLPMALADASLVILAADLCEGRILSTDLRDFRDHPSKSTQPFNNVLLSD